MPSSRTSMFPLLRYFSIASFPALALVTAVVVGLQRETSLNHLIERGEDANVALTQAFANSMWPHFQGYVTGVSELDGDALRSRPETAEIRQTLHALTHDLPILKIKIYNLDGLTVFSTEESQIGEWKSDNPGFISAARDELAASKLSRRGTFSAFSGEVYDRAIVETYVPLHVPLPEGNDEVEAVFEVYSDVTALIALIDAAQRRLLVQLILIFGALYGVLFLTVRRADRILKRQYDQIVTSERLLAEEKQQAEAADRAKSEFLANMSHEIRTPMTAILGFAEILSDEGRRDHTPPQRRRAIETIRRNGEHLLEIINGILDLSKIEAGRLEIENVPFSPTALAEDVVSLMRVRGDAKGLGLELHVESSTPAGVRSDPTRIRQILVNLVGNAVKFTETGTVRLSVRCVDAPGEPKLRFEVADTGIGIPSHQVAELFEAFSQSDTTPARKYGGTGLGLAICRRLTLLLGGTIEVKSRPGRGSTFCLTLPVSLVDREHLIYRESERRPLPTAAPLADAPRLAAGCRVLVAEDSADSRALIVDTLQAAGAEVEVAENGAVALERVLEAERGGRPFDVVLMDMQMPVMDGAAAVRELRGSGHAVPVIALTAHAMPGDRQRCLDLGCDDYAAKPIDRGTLIEIVASHAASFAELRLATATTNAAP